MVNWTRDKVQYLITQAALVVLVVVFGSLALGTAKYFLHYSLPVPDPAELFTLATADRSGELGPVPSVVLASNDGAVENGVPLAHFRYRTVKADIDSTISIPNVDVSGNFFQILRVLPFSGRLLANRSVIDTGKQQEIVISHRFYLELKRSRPEPMGSSLLINGDLMRVIGVLPPEFIGPQPGFAPDVYTLDTEPTAHVVWLFGRFKSQAGASSAAALLTSRIGQWLKSMGAKPEMIAEAKVVAFSAAEGLSMGGRDQSAFAAVVVGSAATLVLIGLVNSIVVGLGRLRAKQSELQIRLALGATPLRANFPRIQETFVAVTLGYAAGVLALQIVASDMVHAIFDTEAAYGVTAILDTKGLPYGFGLGLLSLLLCCSLPLFQLRQAQSTRGPASSNRKSVLSVSLALQSAVAIVSVYAALQLGISYRRLDKMPPGYEVLGRYVATIDFRGTLDAKGKTSASAQRSSLSQVSSALSLVQEVPGVTAAAVARNGPGNGRPQTTRVFRSDSCNPDGEPSNADVISSRFFEALGVKVLQGRVLNKNDAQSEAKVVVVDEVFAKHRCSGTLRVGDAIRLEGRGETQFVIVGVVPPVRYGEARVAAKPTVFIPLQKDEDLDRGTLVFSMHSLATLSPGNLEERLRGAGVSGVFDTKPLIRVLDDSTRRERGLAIAGVAVAWFTAMLALMGLFSHLSVVFAARRREIDIRIALGSPMKRIVTDEGGHVLGWVLFGSGAGVVLSYAAGVLLQTVLFDSPGVSTTMLSTAWLIYSLGAAAVVALLVMHAVSRSTTINNVLKS